jgi:crossover junction endodeoxyribonuclease RuvC
VIVLGIDPGVRCTGYGVVANRDGAVTLVECGVIRTESRAPLVERLRDIYDGITHVLVRHAIEEAAIERVFHGKNAATSLLLGHARAAAMLAATLHHVPVAEYSATQVKTAVAGTGRATKEQIQYMVQQLLRLRTRPRPADAADGVAVAMCHCSLAGVRAKLAGRSS